MPRYGIMKRIWLPTLLGLAVLALSACKSSGGTATSMAYRPDSAVCVLHGTAGGAAYDQAGPGV